MKSWATLVVLLYFLILVALTWPLGRAAFYGEHDLNITDIYTSSYYWAMVGVMVVAQALLLGVSVKVASRRPMTRRSLFPALAACGFMTSLLVAAVIFTLHEGLTHEILPQRFLLRTGAEAGGALWLFWTVLFYVLSRDAEPKTAILRQCRYLLRGSILELLIAVPTHLFARHKDYCCAGVSTFFGLAMGTAVMLFSFGPGIFFLFADRWNKLHPEKPQSPNPVVVDK